MPHDPAMIEEVRGWLDRADTDLRAGRHDLSADPPLLEDVLFHAQQAAEKAMKALLSWHDRPFPKTHDLSRLGADCAAVDPSLTAAMRLAAPLTEYAWRYRYPGPAEPVDLAEAMRGLETAAEVLAAVRRGLPADLRQ